MLKALIRCGKYSEENPDMIEVRFTRIGCMGTALAFMLNVERIRH